MMDDKQFHTIIKNVPYTVLVKMLLEASQAYLSAPTKENKENIARLCHYVAVKEVLETVGIDDLQIKVDNVRKIMNTLGILDKDSVGES